MATHRRPKGVYSRNTIDFYSDRLASVACCYDNSTTFKYSYFHWWFVNNSNAGEAIFVWFLHFIASAAVNQIVVFDGSPGGSLVATGHSVYSNGRTPPGALYLDNGPEGNSAAVDPFFSLTTPTPSLIVMAAPGATVMPIFRDIPIVLMPGASLRCYFDYFGNSSSISVAYTYGPGIN